MGLRKEIYSLTVLNDCGAGTSSGGDGSTNFSSCTMEHNGEVPLTTWKPPDNRHERAILSREYGSASDDI